LRDRPLTLKRYPNGVEGEFFYEKNCPAHRPPWVKTAPIWSDQNRRVMQFCLVQDIATLAWATNLADLEMHVPLHRARSVDRPDSVVFDLDPESPPTSSNAARWASSCARCSNSSGWRRWQRLPDRR